MQTLRLDAPYSREVFSPALKTVYEALGRGNVALASAILMLSNQIAADSPTGCYLVGYLAITFKMPGIARQRLSRAVKLAPDWEAPKRALEAIREITPKVDIEKYILIKAWGSGFWSDIDHVLGQLLLAEITKRTPVIYWGENSLYEDGEGGNAFTQFFEPPSNTNASDLLGINKASVWPPKWGVYNLMKPELNKFSGSHSRVSGLHFLGRSEDILVSDFHTGIIEIIPWIPEESRLYGAGIDEVYRYLANKYLIPTRKAESIVNGFIGEVIEGRTYLGVHVRGSDKGTELLYINEAYPIYHEEIGLFMNESPAAPQVIFLQTDDERILSEYIERYGDRLVYLDCNRSKTNVGIHYQAGACGSVLGFEVLADTLISSRADCFVGLGYANASYAVSYLKDWPTDRIRLIGPRVSHDFHAPLHNW